MASASVQRAKGWLARTLSARTRRRLKGGYRKARAPLRSARRRLSDTHDRSDLAAALAVVIDAGDVVMVHSALSRIGNVEGGAVTVIESLMDVVTTEGTILMPIYGDAETVLEDARLGIVTDLRETRSLTGKVTEAFRAWPGARCSSHPFSSVCAWGQEAEYVTRDHALEPRIAHAASPIGRLLELEGKVVGLGVSLGPVSFYHVLEDTWEQFPFQTYGPPERLTYVDHGGETVTREVRRYDAEVRRTRIDQPGSEWIRDRLTEHLRREGILRTFRYGNADSWVMPAKPFYDELKRLASKGVTIYLTEQEWAARGEPVDSW